LDLKFLKSNVVKYMVKRHSDEPDDAEQLHGHLNAFLAADHFAKRLTTAIDFILGAILLSAWQR
jgi:hypothetical protein